MLTALVLFDWYNAPLQNVSIRTLYRQNTHFPMLPYGLIPSSVLVAVAQTPKPHLQDIVLVGIQYKSKSLVPFWIDVIVDMFGPLSAFRARWDEQLHIRVWRIDCTHADMHTHANIYKLCMSCRYDVTHVKINMN